VTDDIRDEAESDEDPSEDTPAAAEAEAPETAPTAEEQVDWEKRYKDRERTVSRQGEEVKLLRQQIAAIEARTSAPAYEPPTPEELAALPPAISQELAYYRARNADMERSDVVATYGVELDGALDFFERSVKLDPSRKGRANALMAAITRLAEDADEPAPEPAPKPKAPARMESNRSDAAPPADEARLVREAQTTREPKSMQAVIAARLRSATRG